VTNQDNPFASFTPPLVLLTIMTHARESSFGPHLGGKAALAVFVAMIFSFVGETQLTQVMNL
jgi:hypothetical protein